MAAPASKNVKALDGKWILNKTHSHSTDPVLALQGIGWLTRKAINIATVTQHLKQYTAPPDGEPNGTPIVHIDIDQTATGGIKGTSEKRNLDWKYRPHSDHLFGELQGKSRFNTLAAILEENAGKDGFVADDAKFLVAENVDEKEGGWLEETRSGEVVESYVENDKSGWTAWQIWGFSLVNGERWLTRRFVVRKIEKDEVQRVRLVYEWAGENDA